MTKTFPSLESHTHPIPFTLSHVHHHTGTHIDVHSHLFIDGTTIDLLTLSGFILTLVLDITHKKARECITYTVEPADRICPGTVVLFYTSYCKCTTTTIPPSQHDSGLPAHHYFVQSWLAPDFTVPH
ncbi:hypothetical protein BJV74DRAFT_910173 [Russula compacta]|nr:hypothetical protein BJV74DRAFT_910173 [Russula compacta]